MIKISGYKIIKKIGSGGMGDVYLAEHEKLEKKVAIKSLHKNLAADPNFRERFSQEAKTHSKLDHPNIVKLLDYKERKDGLFLIMEYVDGIQLDEHIKKVTGPIPEKELTHFEEEDKKIIWEGGNPDGKPLYAVHSWEDNAKNGVYRMLWHCGMFIYNNKPHTLDMLNNWYINWY